MSYQVLVNVSLYYLLTCVCLYGYVGTVQICGYHAGTHRGSQIQKLELRGCEPPNMGHSTYKSSKYS